MKTTNNNLKYKQIVNIYLALLISILILLLLGLCISSIVKNNLDVDYIKENYIKPIQDFSPEKDERLQYIILTIFFPIIYISSYKILTKIKEQEYKFVYYILTISSTILLFVLTLWIIIFSKESYILGTILNYSYTAIFWIPIIIIYNISNKKLKKMLKYVFYIILLCLIALLSYIYINTSFAQCHYSAYHADAYYYPIMKISGGLTPYIDFTPLYGCYSYFYAFLQVITNNYTILMFSIINAFFVVIILTSLAIVSNKLIKNKIIFLLVCLLIMYSTIVFNIVINNSPYLQYMPHRMIFPAIILLFIIIYLKFRKKKNLQIIGFIISSIAIFWNIETGLITLITWTAFLEYEVLFFNSFKNKQTYIAILKIILKMFIFALLPFIIIILIGYFRTSEIISIKDILSSQTFFYVTGYYMIKMNLCHPGILLVTTYLIGLAISLKQLFFMNNRKGKLFKKSACIFALSILGIGVFSYYQGRSHDQVFQAVLYPGYILIGIYADTLIRQIRLSKNNLIKLAKSSIFVLILIIMSSIATNMIVELIQNKNIHLYLNKKQLYNINILQDFSQYDFKSTEFITLYESLYYSKYNITDTKLFPAFVDVFTYRDCEKIVEYLKESNKNVIMDSSLYNIIKNKYDVSYIENKYDLVNTDDYMILRKRGE